MIVPVVPPNDEVTIDHPTKDSISHYKVHLVPIPEETETPTTETPGGPIGPPEAPPSSDTPLPSTGGQENMWALGALGLAVLMAGLTMLARGVRD